MLIFADLINKLLSQGKQLLAVKFVFEFQLTDKFPPVPLLKEYLKVSKKLAKKVCREGKNSLKSLVIYFPFRKKRKTKNENLILFKIRHWLVGVNICILLRTRPQLKKLVL